MVCFFSSLVLTFQLARSKFEWYVSSKFRRKWVKSNFAPKLKVSFEIYHKSAMSIEFALGWMNGKSFISANCHGKW